jgi:hypothetical protein
MAQKAAIYECVLELDFASISALAFSMFSNFKIKLTAPYWTGQLAKDFATTSLQGDSTNPKTDSTKFRA